MVVPDKKTGLKKPLSGATILEHMAQFICQAGISAIWPQNQQKMTSFYDPERSQNVNEMRMHVTRLLDHAQPIYFALVYEESTNTATAKVRTRNIIQAVGNASGQIMSEVRQNQPATALNEWAQANQGYIKQSTYTPAAGTTQQQQQQQPQQPQQQTPNNTYQAI